MPLPLLQPKFTAFVPGTSTPLIGGQVFTYSAGTSTPLATYPTYNDAVALTNANSNPVILDANGQAAIWAPDLSWYKVVLEDASNNIIYTQDNYHPSQAFGIGLFYTGQSANTVAFDWLPIQYAVNINNVSGGPTFSFVSSTSFTVNGVDVTGILTPGRRVKTVNTGGTIYSTVRLASFGGGNSTITVVNDSGVLDGGLSAVSFGSQPYANPAYLDPRTSVSIIKNGNQTGFGGATTITPWTVQQDNLSEFSVSTWNNKYPGNYLVIVTIEFSDTGTNISQSPTISSNATSYVSPWISAANANVHTTMVAQHLFNYTTANQAALTISLAGSANTTVYGGQGTTVSILRIP